MKLRLLNRRRKEETPEIDDLLTEFPIEWFEEEELLEMEETFSADWVKRQMDEEEWRKMSEKERQALIARTKLAQRKDRAYIF